jgi:hypothetical protein
MTRRGKLQMRRRLRLRILMRRGELQVRTRLRVITTVKRGELQMMRLSKKILRKNLLTTVSEDNDGSTNH